MASQFPPPPTNSIDWSDIGFRVREVNGHIEAHYNKTSGKWTEPEFVQDPFLRIHGMAPGLNYGQQAFEGQKAFRRPDGSISIFRPGMNAKRLAHSASVLSIPEVPYDLFMRCVNLAVALNAEFVPPHETGAAMYIRPNVFGSSAQLGLNPPEEYMFVVYVMPTGVYHGLHPVDALILEDFDRAAPEGVGHAKVGGNYGPVLKFSDRARNEGFGITLHLDSKTRTEIDEFSTSGLIGVKKDGDSYTVVVPDSKQIIKSVTSDSICQLAQSFGWKVEARPIKYEELKDFTEVMAAGTAAALVPIKSITMRSRNDKFQYNGGSEEPGEVCVRLLKNLKGIQAGTVKDSFGWCEMVQEPKNYKARLPNKAQESTNGIDTVMVDKLP